MPSPSAPVLLRKTPSGDYRSIPMTEPQPGPEYSPYEVWCDAEYVNTVWIRPQQFGVDPRDIAERLVRDLPYPQATVGAVRRDGGVAVDDLGDLVTCDGLGHFAKQWIGDR